MKPKFIQILYFMAIIATIVACKQHSSSPQTPPQTPPQTLPQTPADNEVWYTTTDGEPLGLTQANCITYYKYENRKRHYVDISSISDTKSPASVRINEVGDPAASLEVIGFHQLKS